LLSLLLLLLLSSVAALCPRRIRLAGVLVLSAMLMPFLASVGLAAVGFPVVL
jgi:hypothetical protein